MVCVSGAADAASNAPVSELILKRPAVTVTPHTVRFSYGLGIKGLVSIRDQLRDGAHMLLEGNVSLLQGNIIRPNSELASVPVAWTLRHDPLTRDFILMNEEGAVRRGPFIDTLLRDAWTELHADMFLTEPMEGDQTYILRLNLVLRYAEVPPWLRKALFFWSGELSPVLDFERRFTLSEAMRP